MPPISSRPRREFGVVRLIASLSTLAASVGPLSSDAFAAKETLHAEMTHLRSGDHREWADFPEEANGPSLEVRFQSKANSQPATLGLRRVDVKEDWRVELNGQKVADLFSDENDMREAWELPPGTLRDGENIVTVRPTGDKVDDVRIGEVWIDERPRAKVFGEATLRLSTRGDDDSAMPCRYTIVDASGSMAALDADAGETIAFRSGVVYTDGREHDIRLAAGEYTVYCTRGFEYDMQRWNVSLQSGDLEAMQFRLTRQVLTPGLVAVDPHVHTFEISRHGDASLAERMVTLAGEGIEVAVAADHNAHVDYRPHLKRSGLNKFVTPIIGNEVTTKFGHFNIFPIAQGAKIVDHNVVSWETLADSIFATPDVRVAILNHPRDLHAGFRPFGPENMIAATGERIDGRSLRANCFELINSAALQSDPMVLFRDWMSLINRGVDIAAVGTSDSHEVSRKIVGQGRTYVPADDADPGAVDVPDVAAKFAAGRTLVSLGLLARISPHSHRSSPPGEVALKADDESFVLACTIEGPDWIQARDVEVYVNGQLAVHGPVDARSRWAAGLKMVHLLPMERPGQDVHVVLVARGPGVTAPYWPIAKPYQPTDTYWSPYVFGCSSVLRIDVDGGGWTPPIGYAARCVEESGKDFAKLIASLEPYDQPTATFAAELWEKAHGPLDAEQETQLEAAAEHVGSGFDAYRRSRAESFRARAAQ